MKLHQISSEFVDEIPLELEPGKLYVCYQYRAVKHLCPCGCGVVVNTPVHPTGWTLIFDGASVSLWPSIGNWSEPCQSHYWIQNNKIKWAPKWSGRKIQRSRQTRELELSRYFVTNSLNGMDQSARKNTHNFAFQFRRIIRLFNRCLGGK